MLGSENSAHVGEGRDFSAAADGALLSASGEDFWLCSFPYDQPWKEETRIFSQELPSLPSSARSSPLTPPDPSGAATSFPCLLLSFPTGYTLVPSAAHSLLWHLALRPLSHLGFGLLSLHACAHTHTHTHRHAHTHAHTHVHAHTRTRTHTHRQTESLEDRSGIYPRLRGWVFCRAGAQDVEE